VPALAGYRAFRKARADYRAWKTRTLLAFWRGLSGRAFEHELALLFDRKGYSVELTPATGDKGIDIVVERDGRKTIVQCKATSKPVGPAVARELYGTLVASGADDAILATIGGVTSGTREFLRGKAIKILTITEIVAWHSEEVGSLPNLALQPSSGAPPAGRARALGAAAVVSARTWRRR
jgi:HJR/Mrr/RecB family endonuclease